MAFAFVFTYQDNHLVTDTRTTRPKANGSTPITSALHQQHLLKQQTTPELDQSLLRSDHASAHDPQNVVEPRRIELLTSCVQGRRSPS